MDGLLSVPAGWRWLITLAFTAMIVLLSVTPGTETSGDSMFVWLVVNTATPVQKAMHVSLYAVLAALWMWALQPLQHRGLRIVLSFLASAGLGAALEWHQTSVPGRFGTVIDVVLNTCGAVAGLILALVIL